MAAATGGGEAPPPPLHPIEAQRAIAVLEDAREKLLFLSRITPGISEHKQELSQAVGDEIQKLMAEQQELEARFEALTRARQEAEVASNRAKKKEITEELKSLSHALRESSKHLARSLKENPNVGENLEKISAEREELQALLGVTIQQLKEGGTFTALVDFIQAEKEATQRLRDIEDQERAMRERVRELSSRLDAESSKHEADMEEKTAHIERLKAELRTLRIETTLESRVARKEAVASTAAVARLHRAVEEEKQAEVASVASRKATELRVHSEVAAFLAEQHKALAAKVKEWEARTGEDVASKQAELKGLLAELLADEAELGELTSRFAAEEAAASQRQAELQASLQAKQHAKRLAELQAAAAERLQGALLPKWQHIKVKRSAEKELKKKKKGNKK